MAESKTISFRADPDTIAKLDSIAEGFESKQDMLNALINTFEVQGAKTVLPTSIAGRLEDMETHLNGINRIMLDLADAYNNVKTNTREQFSALLNTKDSTIADLQTKVKDLQAALQTAELDAEQRVREAEQEAQQQIADAHAELAVANKDLIALQKQVLDLQAQLLQIQQTQQAEAKPINKGKTTKSKTTQAE